MSRGFEKKFKKIGSLRLN